MPKQFVIVDSRHDVILLRDGAWMGEASIRQKDEFSYLYVPRTFPSKAAGRAFINQSFRNGTRRFQGRYKTAEWSASQLSGDPHA